LWSGCPSGLPGLGLREGELLGLRLSDVDFLRRIVMINYQLDPDSPDRGRTEPKTRRSRRPLPLPEPVAEAIAAHLAKWGPGQDGSVWTTKSGRPPRHDHYNKSIAGARERAGLPASTTSHDLRHHYASVLIAAGASVVEVAELLGHKDGGALVLKTYAHLFPESEERARRAIEAAWRATGEDRGSAPDVPPGQSTGQ